MAILLVVLFAAFALYPESPVLGLGGFLAGTGSVVAVARVYWASSTRKIRERIGAVMDAIGETLARPDDQVSAAQKVRDDTKAPEPLPGAARTLD